MNRHGPNFGGSCAGPRRWLAASLVAVLLGGCVENRFATRTPSWADELQSAADTVSVTPPLEQNLPPTPDPVTAATQDRADFYRPGNDNVVAAPAPVADARVQANGDIKLNFQNANLLEVVKVVMGDMLGLNYTVDPAVQGAVSMQTTRALGRDDLMPTLELLLRMNGAALVDRDGLYRIVPLASALAEVQAPQIGDTRMALPAGFNVQVVPLQYVAAEEMAQILTPFVSANNQLLRVDTARNLLILADSGSNMERLLDTIDVFDVDRMAGMSVALFTPDFVEAATLAADLEQLLADPQYGLMSGLVRFIVVERLNGLIVVTPRAEHLARVREWITRLDRNTGDASPRLFVYRVQNGKATDLAAMLSDVFAGSDKKTPVSLAPGLQPATVGKEPGNDQPERPTPLAAARENLTQGLQINPDNPVKIIADEPNNALLILARGTEYRQILAALRQLDVSPMQVLIEVTIAEVTLTDNLEFGVEWYFNEKVGSSKRGIGRLDLGAAGIGPVQPGFSYAITNGADTVYAVLNALATESNLSIISSPTLLVLNNQEANIQVGEEVPVATQQQQSTSTDANIINSIEYRNTGVLLKVKPRINAGGLVIMEVEQETSQVPATNNADPLTPRIQTRNISSTVAVNSGDTIILGGLIIDNRDTAESGVPVLHKIPGLGALFGSKADNQGRTELIVLITPRAVSNSTAALQVTEEFRRRLQKLIPSREKPPTEDATAAP
ncbi:MAG: type II secretion system secretin GspD [Gammaproteobacteria bacterium]|nr:type II secretion system secretin GspD [Gammaproteobacteria bacterium]